MTPAPRPETPAEVLCAGEVLWDSLPLGLFLGGAPVNVAANLRSLGVAAAVVTRVGNDMLGREAVRRLERRGIRTDLIQKDPELGTGFVAVTLGEGGDPSFEILHPVAWDNIECTDALIERAAAARAVVFGSLAQRAPASRETIRALCGAARRRVFDVNLRPPFDDREVVRSSLQIADVVKLNDEELKRLAGWFDLPQEERLGARRLGEAFSCETVCVTRGARGALVWHDGAFAEHGGFSVEVQDAVGAGDAFLAALLDGLLAGRDLETTLQRANAAGAFVATQMGAMPVYDREVIERMCAGEGGPEAPASG